MKHISMILISAAMLVTASTAFARPAPPHHRQVCSIRHHHKVCTWR